MFAAHVAPHRLDLTQARRIAIRAQMLDAERPAALLDLLERLTCLQLDPTAAIAPSADLVAWSRMGGAYRPEQLRTALETDRSAFEYRAFVRPMADLPLYLAHMAQWPNHPPYERWLDANAGFRRYILDTLRDAGPLLSRDLEDRSEVPWPSSGWTNNKNVTQMLEFLAARGEIAVSARKGRQRYWDIGERVFAEGLPVIPLEAAARQRDERRLRALGIARATGTAEPVEPSTVGEAGEPALVEGTAGEWRVHPEALDVGDFAGRTALLSPFDRLIHDRKRTEALFGFEYTLEMYKPAAKRRWGYFALPILHDDALVGKLDATADRKASVLRVHAVHEDARFTKAVTRAVRAEVTALAEWLALADVVYE